MNQDALTQLQTAQTAIGAAVTDLSSQVAVVNPNDAVVASVVSALEAAGYTVTAPVVDTTPETPAEDATDTATEA